KCTSSIRSTGSLRCRFITSRATPSSVPGNQSVPSCRHSARCPAAFSAATIARATPGVFAISRGSPPDVFRCPCTTTTRKDRFGVVKCVSLSSMRTGTGRGRFHIGPYQTLRHHPLHLHQLQRHHRITPPPRVPRIRHRLADPDDPHAPLSRVRVEILVPERQRNALLPRIPQLRDQLAPRPRQHRPAPVYNLIPRL